MQDTTKEISEKPASTQERYTTATQASNLRVQAERSGPADLLIGMAWSPTRLGAALLRLVSEWDACERPRKQGHDAIEKIAYTKMVQRGTRKDMVLTAVNGKKQLVETVVPNMVPDMAAAQAQAQEWYVHELKMLFQKLKTMPEVRAQLTAWILDQGIADASRRSAEVLAWWLHNTCPVCEGRKKERIPGTPSLSHRDCPACKGSGVTRVPHGLNNTRELVESWKILKHIDVCVKSAQGALQVRLRGMRDRPKKEKV